MKKITQKEFESLNVRSGIRNPVLAEVSKLEVGEHLIVAPEDWKKRVLTSAIHSIKKGTYSARSLKEGGWVVTRKS